MVSDWPRAIAQGWHPVAYRPEVRARPLPIQLLGENLVAFRDAAGGIAVLQDRCPHRGVPLSQGRLRDGTLVCPYHGWRFAGDGRLVEVPGARTCPPVKARALPVREDAGLVWTCLAADPPPFPDLPPVMSDPALDRFWWPLAPSRAGLLDALENHLDPAHPHFVHPWLVRPPTARRTTRVEVRSGPWGAEARYIEQRANRALLSAVMEGERKAGIGRLWPPTCGEVRLENARGAMLSIAVVFSPLDHDLTRPYAHFASTRGLLPAWFKRAALKLFHLPVLAQDRRMLGWQADARGPGGFAFGPLDVLARSILRHAHGEPSPEEEASFELDL
jgi:phenylpropionate dioxygenase-like ring-hydroxylating dioxygenase large terminal subunit